MKKIALLFLLVLVIPMAAVFAEDSNTPYGAAGAARDKTLTLKEMLEYAIQDEYLARAEYDLIISKYGNIRPFSNIMQAEEQHILWLKEVYTNHGLQVPADTSSGHVTLPPDLKSSFKAGIKAEEDNIAMYKTFLGEDLPADVKDVFERLMNSSVNHLSAFRNNASKY